MGSGYEFKTRVMICPVCGKEFVPAPEHVYRSDFTKKEAKKLGKDDAFTSLVCSWHCVREHEKHTINAINKETNHFEGIRMREYKGNKERTGKLSRTDIEEICSRYYTDDGVTQTELAEEYGVSKSTISNIIYKSSYTR